MIGKLIELAEAGRLPDAAVRAGMRSLLAARLRSQSDVGFEGASDAREGFIAMMRASPIAVRTDSANEQHYEVPAEFFERVLGPNLKYSSCLWPDGVETLEGAEQAMLDLTCERAGLEDGQRVLELGCGWGSLTLWMARRYPRSVIHAVSNSASQKALIEARCRDAGVSNVTVHTADMNDFAPDDTFDRVVSIEMFEHMRNVPALLERIESWLRPGGKLFVHVFCNREHDYLFETEGDANWMGRYFFTGGMMPSEGLYLRCQDHLRVDRVWRVNGVHYARTLRAWLDLCDRGRDDVLRILGGVYGEEQAATWLHRWRMFFMACEELFAYEGGTQWYVVHYKFSKPH